VEIEKAPALPITGNAGAFLVLLSIKVDDAPAALAMLLLRCLLTLLTLLAQSAVVPPVG